MKSKPSDKPAVLALESGRIFVGRSFGARAEKFGEVVFNTSMTGYQEILTDPSYKGQIILMTEPHIGNVGVNPDDCESLRAFCEGLIVREASLTESNWRSRGGLREFLVSGDIPAIFDIDTRALTKHLRDMGAMRGVLSTQDFDAESLLKKVRKSPSIIGQDYVKDVTSPEAYEWNSREWKWVGEGFPNRYASAQPAPAEFNVVVMDFGVKQNILRCLVDRRCRVTVVPAQTGAEEILSRNPDGVLLSNGPGDPAAVTYAISTIKKLIDLQSASQNPFALFGICLGHQLLGIALGGTTFKLKFGHHSANHPVKNLSTGRVEITTQNHGFCVDTDSLAGKDIEMTHLNLNDQTSEGMRHKSLPLFSVQYHPESSGGPRDSRYLFDDFIRLMKQRKYGRDSSQPETSNVVSNNAGI